MFNTINYWENRYKSGKTSGDGSYGTNAKYKAFILNSIIKDYQIQSLIEFGCGDGNNLALYEIEKYIGFDVSKKAIELCIKKYMNDKNKTFLYYEPNLFQSSHAFQGDISISFEVLFHLIEDSLYKKYLKDLFTSSQKYVLIFSSNIKKEKESNHMIYREFTKDIDKNFQLIKTIKTPSELNLIADFYLFERIRLF